MNFIVLLLDPSFQKALQSVYHFVITLRPMSFSSSLVSKRLRSAVFVKGLTPTDAESDCVSSSHTCVSLLSLLALPAIPAISSRDSHVPVRSRGPTGARFARWAGWSWDAADEARGSLQLPQDTVAQTDHSHQRPHLQICGYKQQKCLQTLEGPVCETL